MVKMLQLLSVTSGIVAADDSASLLQLEPGQSAGNRIITAVAKGHGDTICVEVAVGDIAPVPGSFTASMGQQAVEVAAGTVAEEQGSFCVAKATVLLLQRTDHLHTANDVDSALQSKKSKDQVNDVDSAEQSKGYKAAPKCEFFNVGTPRLGKEENVSPSDKATYQKYLQGLDVGKLYDTIVRVMKTSQECWPADGPQDNDKPSYAGLFGRLAWHCSGTFRIVNGKATGGCEGGRQRHWPEKEWSDNAGLDQARAILAEVKSMQEYQDLSWGDLMTFAGTVGIKASGGQANKFCFGRIDEEDGRKSIMLGSEGITQCELGDECVSHAPCETNFRWPDQDLRDHVRCNETQADGRFQGSHAVGLIYVYPEGPQLRPDHPNFDPTQKHQRSQKLSALEVRDTFTRMGWTDEETVALIGGGHTLGRNHGNCAAKTNPAEPCIGKFTSSSGFEGAWTRTPSQWNYDYFKAMLDYDWVATKSPDGQDQWATKDRESPFAQTVRLTADLALVTDPVYRELAIEYNKNHSKFDNAFAKAWFRLTHRSEGHPQEDDLEKDAKKCTSFDFLPSASLLQMSKQGEDTICVQAAAGDVAPVTGSFTAIDQAAVVVAAGSVAGETGTFCYAKQDVLLMQRTFVSNTAHDLENAVASKGGEKPVDNWDAQASDGYVKHEGKICSDLTRRNLNNQANNVDIDRNQDGQPWTASQCRAQCDTVHDCVAFGYGGSPSPQCMISGGQKCSSNSSLSERQGEGAWYIKKDARKLLCEGARLTWSCPDFAGEDFSEDGRRCCNTN